jgi:hypothetical protein
MTARAFRAAGFCCAPGDPGRSLRFHRDVVGVAVCLEFGPADHGGMVFFSVQGLRARGRARRGAR